MKGYKLFDLSTQFFFIFFKDVVFHDHLFPFHSSTSLVNPSPSTSFDSARVSLRVTISDLPIIPTPPISASHFPSFPYVEPHTVHSDSYTETPSPIALPIAPSSPALHLLVRKSFRLVKPPSYLQDYHYNLISSSSLSLSSSSDVVHPIQNTLSYSHLFDSHKAFTLAISTLVEPHFYHEAVTSPQWCDAMSKELAALEANHTWLITSLLPCKHPIRCKWVYKLKFKLDGSTERYNARLVAKGYNQNEGINYFATFSPVAKLVTVKSFVAIATAKGWSLTQLDVNNAFLHGDLDEEVFMTLPPSFKIDSKTPAQVCKLTKSLYGLKQVPRQWFSKFSSTFLDHGFVQSKCDYSLLARLQVILL